MASGDKKTEEFEESYSPVPYSSVILLDMSVAKQKSWYARHFGMPNTFPTQKLKRPTYK